MDYSTIIDKSLALLEAERKKRVLLMFKIIIAIILVLAGILYYYTRFIFTSQSIFFIGIAVSFLITATIVLSYFFHKSFVKIYKTTFITPLMQKMFPDLEYTPNKYIEKSTFTRSSLYKGFNIYRGDDYFKGKLDKCEIEFSELNVYYQSSNSGSNNNSSSKSVVFNGLFCSLSFDESLTDSPITVTSNMSEVLNALPQFLRGIISKFIPDYGTKVIMGNSGFDSRYSTYCDDEESARLLLNDAVIELIEELSICAETIGQKVASKTASTINIRVQDNEVYIAVPSDDLFRVKFIRSISNTKGDILAYCELINNIINLSNIIGK